MAFLPFGFFSVPFFCLNLFSWGVSMWAAPKASRYRQSHS